MEVRKAARTAPAPAQPQGARLLSPEETTALRAREEEAQAPKRDETSEPNADTVFAKLKTPKAEEA
jgi:hypothetical protein